MQPFPNYLLIGFLLMFRFNDPPKPANTAFIAQKPVSVAQLVVPGKSIGQTKLKEDAVLVYKKLGRPDAGDAAMGKSLATWYAGHHP